ncbi:YbaB/EbfC family nucleoid-associated protein [Cryptosporangium phraense]|uniref:YbaB/EbfC family nucleoid-associated protein n=1 Tax=Cryptosporangium phraense TaxID=2593070 RepID=A0A545AH23_9ACTN|nr:YbaB/EbfC family nucleoid-associated protein [Cryptosporangium phraense]TQS40622.1 YbaB/EbfC family nucleoid-associated protein [Cryptosporangium phraense]
MSDPLRYDAENALAELRAQQAKIKAAGHALATAEATASSKDKMIEATVNSQGRLIGLKLRGDRYRDLAPAELANKIVEVVAQAQTDAAAAATAAFAGLLPGIMPDLSTEGGFDFDAMFDEAVEKAKQPMFPGDDGFVAGEKDGDQRG